MRQVVIKSHHNYGFVIYKRDTLIGRHIPDNNTLKGRVWNLARVCDDGNGKQANGQPFVQIRVWQIN